MTQLKTCEACTRHVFVTETSCPFCEAQLPALRIVPRFKLRAGLSRAQRFAVAAAIVGQTAVGCAESKEPNPGGSAGGSAGEGGSAGQVAVPHYGAPFDAGTNGGASGAGAGGAAGAPGVAMPVYGAPFIDAGHPDIDDDAGPTDDDDAG